MLTTLLSFAFVLGLLIFVHEFGHFITAKMVGIRVERFSLGFPPRMIGKKIGDTDYCISWLPLGGYVKMAGMIDENLDANIKGEPYEFASKPVWQRSIVLSAGSVMNILTAIVIFTALTLANGVPRPEGALISEVIQGKPADLIGLKAGDVITSIDDQPIKTSEELTSIIHKHPGQQVTITWLRDGQEFHSPVVPEPQPDTHIGLIGIRVGTKMHYEKAGLAESLSFGVSNSFTILKLTVQSLKLIITGQESFRDAVGGPIIIAKLAGESARLGFQSLLTFTAIISLNLGFFNLLPFPVLDGGHLVLLLLEGIRRKPIPVKTRLVIQKVGMAFLLALMVFILINDITRWKNFKF